jgi:small subunit ribosomal protein S6
MTTRAYEALVILKTAGTEQEIARQVSHLEELVKKVGGRVGSAQAMGRRKLAFRISRQHEGHYHLLRFHAPTERIGELERTFRLNEASVRFIIVSAEEVPGPTRQAAASPQPAVAQTRS